MTRIKLLSDFPNKNHNLFIGGITRRKCMICYKPIIRPAKSDPLICSLCEQKMPMEDYRLLEH